MTSSKKSCDGSVSKLERKTVEKNRRLMMKNLCYKLSSLIPKQTHAETQRALDLSKEAVTQKDHLEEATAYIKKLQERIDGLKGKKEMGVVIDDRNPEDVDESEEVRSSETPIVEIRELGNSISEVLVICGRNNRFVLYDAVGVVEEEGAEVINATTSNVGANICYTIHSQIMVPRIGLDVSRLEEKLRKLMN